MSKTSKFLALVLRHNPDVVGIKLDAGGWVAIKDLLRGLREAGRAISRTDLEKLVTEDAKGRYAFSKDGQRIRAEQGHSVAVDLGLIPVTPPTVLYHGTVRASLNAIFTEGLRPMARHHVHLSPDAETAKTVGARRGKPLVLEIDAAAMAADDHLFYRSGNGVWLTDLVPPQYLRFTPASVSG